MKKIISLALVLCMSLSLSFPSSVFAKEGTELEKIISIVKSKIEVPEKLNEFNYSINSIGKKTIWNLTWNSKNYQEGNMNISVSSEGTIIYYNLYKGYDSTYISGKLPKVSKVEAQKNAFEFLEKINPDAVLNISLKEDNNMNLMNSTYEFNYARLIDGITLYDNGIYVGVDKNTGVVQNYSLNWSDDLNIPSSDNPISTIEAKKAYKDSIGLTLYYNYRMENDKLVTYLSYKPKYDNKYIDATTGKAIDLVTNYYGPYYRGAMSDSINYSTKEKSLSPEEQSAVDEVSASFSSEDAEKLARNTQILELGDEFKLNHANLYKETYLNNRLYWTLDFSTEQNISDGSYKYVYVQIDAKTGSIINFNKNYDTNEGAVKYDKEQSKVIVEKFLKEFCPEQFKDTILDEDNGESGLPYGTENPAEKTELPRSHTFTYLRTVNGIPFEGNNISVNFDCVNGKITSYYNNWFDTQFAPVDKVISKEKAYQILFKELGYDLAYKLNYSTNANEKIAMPTYEGNVDPKLEFVYTFDQNKSPVIDAFSGKILDNNGMEYKENVKISYSDIEDSYAKNEINTLAEYGIYISSGTFNPKDNINQKEYLYLLYKTVNPYTEIDIKNTEDLDELYNQLLSEGIVKESEKQPEANVSREESIKYLIRAAKYDKVAEIKGIFTNDFKDFNEINPELLGYVSIAKGLNIISGQDGYFAPKANLNNEQAASLLYNYLQK